MTGGRALLERAINYTLGGLSAVTPEAMSRPTPCRDWDLRALLAHMNDALVALHEAADLGTLRLDPYEDTGADPVTALRGLACGLLDAWDRRRPIAVGGVMLDADVISVVGAMEITVHGWDAARACGLDHPIPGDLAEDLLPLSSLVVTDADRPVRFATSIRVPADAVPGDRLLAYLGRAA